MAVLHVNDSNFDSEVIKSETPVLVDFWAEWCGPCKMVSPILDEIANEMEGKIKIAKVNIDEAQGLASNFNVMSIPTMIIFKDGSPIEQLVGALPKEQLLDRINSKL